MSVITDVITQNNVLDYTSQREYPTQLGEALFPAQRQESLDLEYIKGSKGAPVSASIHAFNTESEIGTREGFQTIKEKIALVKRKIGVDEELLIRLNSAKQGSSMYKSVIDSVYNDIDNMVEAVNVRIERMRYEALATGKIKVSENGADFVVDYGLSNDQKETLADKWTKESNDILDTLFETVDKMVAKGSTPTRILTSRKVLAILAQNASVRQAVLGKDASRRLSLGEINDFMISQGLPIIGTEDRVYRVQNANGTYSTHRYFADNKVVFLPEGPVGHTVFGPTPEEIRLSSNPSVDMSKVGNILAMVYDENVDPVATYTKAVASVLPSFEAADQIHILDVLSPAQ